jgi:hypothetical protein
MTRCMFADRLTIQAAVGPSTTLEALRVVVALAAVSVLPSLAYLLWFTQESKSTLLHVHITESSTRRTGRSPRRVNAMSGLMSSAK